MTPNETTTARFAHALLSDAIETMRAACMIPDLGEVVEAYVDPATNTLHVTKMAPGHVKNIEIDIFWSHDP